MRPPKPTHTIIIGAGIIGVSAAYELARRGHRVTVLERGNVASGASFGNAGIIAVGHTPLPRPGLGWNAIKWMFKRTSPLHIHPRLDPSLLNWLWRFWRCCTAEHVNRLMPALAALSWLSIDRFEDIIRDEGFDCDFHRSGWMEVFESQAQMNHGIEAANALQRFNVRHELLVGDALRLHNPVFRDHVHGAILYTDSAYADPERYLMQLADRAISHGAVIRQNAPAQTVMLENGTFTSVVLASGERIEGDVLVVAAGSWTTELTRALGVRVPMQAAKGYHLDLACAVHMPMTTCVLAETFVAVTPLKRGLRLAGTLELSGINERIDRRRVDMLRIGAARFMHGVDDLAEQSVWSGLRPCAADGAPVIGWAPNRQGIYIATGHAMMGFTLGPGTGRVIAEEILEGEPPINSPSFASDRSRIDLATMRPDRFC
jgi:D-amino-acid dehydrogenase